MARQANSTARASAAKEPGRHRAVPGEGDQLRCLVGQGCPALTCTDEGTFLECTGKVAGLGGTTFRIDVSASGVADVTCTNPGGNVAPGQSFSFAGAGSTGDQLTPRNGQFRFSVETVAPTAPPGSCPNPMWTATVTDVHFTDATLTLFEDSTVADTITAPVT
jgi:hypothetical protein